MSISNKNKNKTPLKFPILFTFYFGPLFLFPLHLLLKGLDMLGTLAMTSEGDDTLHVALTDVAGEVGRDGGGLVLLPIGVSQPMYLLVKQVYWSSIVLWVITTAPDLHNTRQLYKPLRKIRPGGHCECFSLYLNLKNGLEMIRGLNCLSL